LQQQAAGHEGGRAGDAEDKRKAGRAGDVEDKRKAGRAGDVDVKRAARRLSGLTRSAAARRLHGHDDAATIAATTNISRFSSVRDRVEKANGMTVIEAIELNIYTLRTLRSDEAWVYRSGTHIRPDPGLLRARHGGRRPPQRRNYHGW
jgi:hypothetical protein